MQGHGKDMGGTRNGMRVCGRAQCPHAATRDAPMACVMLTSCPRTHAMSVWNQGLQARECECCASESAVRQLMGIGEEGRGRQSACGGHPFAKLMSWSCAAPGAESAKGRCRRAGQRETVSAGHPGSRPWHGWHGHSVFLCLSLCFSVSCSHWVLRCLSMSVTRSCSVCHSVLRCLSMSATRSCFVFLCLDVKPHTLHAKLSAHMRTHAGMRA